MIKRKLIIILVVLFTVSGCVKTKNVNYDENKNNRIDEVKYRLEHYYDSIELVPDNYTMDDIEYIENLYSKKYRSEFRVLKYYKSNNENDPYVSGVIQDLSNKNYPTSFLLPKLGLNEDDIHWYSFFNALLTKRTDQLFYNYFDELLDVDFLLTTRDTFYTNYAIDVTDEELLKFNQEHIFMIFAIEETSEKEVGKVVKQLQNVMNDIYSNYGETLQYLPIFRLYVVSSFDNIKKLTDLHVRREDGNFSIFGFDEFYEEFDYLRYFTNEDNVQQIIEVYN